MNINKLSYFIYILFLSFLPGGCSSPDSGKKDNTINLSQDMKSVAVSEVIHSRKSVRKYIDKPVSDADIGKILRAAMAAPSGKNLQPWFFYVIRDRAVLNNLGEELPTAAMLGDVHVAIMVCGDISKADTTSYKNYWVMDCSAASENILLTAESLGLGACWTAVFPYESRANTVRKYIGIPDIHIPLNIIPLGYEKGSAGPKDKWNPGNIKIIE
jgi:nitroreductase